MLGDNINAAEKPSTNLEFITYIKVYVLWVESIDSQHIHKNKIQEHTFYKRHI